MTLRSTRADRPAVLFLACHLPFPPLSGGRRRELELIKRVSRHVDVDLLVVSKTHQEDLANVHELERVCRRVEVFPADPLPQDGGGAGDALQVLRHRCPALTARVAELLSRGDVDL